MFGRRSNAPDPALDGSESWDDEDDGGGGSFLEVVLTVGAALLLAFLVQAYLVKPFKIPSGSMENTLKCGDRVLVDRLSYRFSDPARKDVIVFNPPAAYVNGSFDTSQVADETTRKPVGSDGTRETEKADTNYIKRIIGLPGDEVEVRGHHASIDGKALKEPYLHPLDDPSQFGSTANFGPVKVPKGFYLMLGDNRNNSADGRVFGFVPRRYIVGKAFMVYWPPKRFGGLPDKDSGGAAARAADPNCQESAVPDGQTLGDDG